MTQLASKIYIYIYSNWYMQKNYWRVMAFKKLCQRNASKCASMHFFSYCAVEPFQWPLAETSLFNTLDAGTLLYHTQFPQVIAALVIQIVTLTIWLCQRKACDVRGTTTRLSRTIFKYMWLHGAIYVQHQFTLFLLTGWRARSMQQSTERKTNFIVTKKTV